MSAPIGTGQVFYPNVSKIPGRGPGEIREEKGVPGEFGAELDRALAKAPLKMSAHATQRLNERKIQLDPATLARVSDAIDRADAKGVEDTLVLTDKAALIVSVKNRTVVTAMDRNQLSGNVFTNIDGAVIV